MHQSIIASLNKRENTVLRLSFIALLIVCASSCSDVVLEFKLESSAIERFEAEAANIASLDELKSPAAHSVLAGNKVGITPGVSVYNPEPTLLAMGIKNGDLIVSVDGKLPSREYGWSFAPGHGKFTSSAHQYVDFVSALLAQRHSREAVLLSVHHKYATIKEREENDGIYKKEPTQIRIIFP